MIMPVNIPQATNLLFKAIPAELQRTSTNLNRAENDKTSIFYINDAHGKSINIERTVAASKAFDSYVSNKDNKTDVLKLSSGDIQLGEPLTANRVMVEAQNIMGVMASAMGNHEYDTPENIRNLIPHMGYKLLACNVNIKSDNPLYGKIEKSYIQDVNGTKYGIIGASPVDLFSRLKYSKLFEELKVDDIDKTIQDIQTETNKLRAQGVDRIILLSHVGFGYDQRIAKETDGIDIILGGHSHNLVTDIKAGVNLFNSKSGEPVVITQAGRDGRFFGILNIEWTDKGTIKKAQNNVTSTRGFKRNPIARSVFEHIIGKPKKIGEIKSAPPPPANASIDPNPHAYFICDCMKEEFDADVALFGAATLRGHFESGKLDTRWLEDISPFKNKMAVANYSEKDLIDALKVSAGSMTSTNNKPGIVFMSGMRYTVSEDGQLRSVSFVDKEGKEIPIDIKNPRTDKFYKTVLTDFYCQGHDGFTMLKKYNEAKIYDFDMCKCIENHFVRHPEPVEIKDDGRFKVVD